MGISTFPCIKGTEVISSRTEDIFLCTTVSEDLWVYPASYSMGLEGLIA
jgi:hypothetical protein